MTNIAGIFSTSSEAERAYSSLLNDGFTTDDISVLLSEDTKNSFFKNTAPTNEIADQGVGGAIAGAGFGALAAGLTVLGMIFIPGVNLLAIGPLAAALTGAGTGAVVGGLSGVINADLESDKVEYEEALKSGKAVLIVHTASDSERMRARAIMGDYVFYKNVA